MDSFESHCLLCPAFFSQRRERRHFPFPLSKVSIPYNPLAFSLQAAELLACVPVMMFLRDQYFD